MTRKPTMKTFAFALMAVAGFAVLTVAWDAGVTPVSASSDKVRKLLVTKECSDFDGTAGSFCTITSSNLRKIKVGSTVFYDQAAGIPAGLLDSNVVLDAGEGDRAVGRCTLDLTTGLGLCTFSDGTGGFAGFNARVNVSPMDPEGLNWLWEGTYSFDSRD
jgi:hypothetical protein